MNDEGIQKYIESTIAEAFRADGATIVKIILFGSRAAGSEDAGSDWDYLVVTEEEVPSQRIKEIKKRIRRALAGRFLSADVIVQSKTRFLQNRSNVGDIAYYAAKQGIAI
jgi:predicted nucleotidyltransferase